MSDISRFAVVRFGAAPHPFVCVLTPAAMPPLRLILIADFWVSTLA